MIERISTQQGTS